MSYYLVFIDFDKIISYRRKRRWEEQQINTENEICQQLMRDVEEGKFFHCTVEVRQKHTFGLAR